MVFYSVCDAITKNIESEVSEPFDRDTLLMEKEMIDSFTILGIIVLLEELLSVEVQPDDLASDNFASISAMAKWGSGQVNSS